MTSNNAVIGRLMMFLPFAVSLVIIPWLAPVFDPNRWQWGLVIVAAIYCSPVVLDLLTGKTRAKVSPHHQPWAAKELEYVLLPRVLSVKIIAAKILALVLIVQQHMHGVALVGTAYLVGQLMGSYGIFVAHELMHRKSWLDRALAELLMVTVTYPHFCVEHVHGHHKYVATPRDPATARRGESVYAFALRSAAMGVVNAWHLEARRLQTRGRSWIGNRMLRYLAEVLAIYAALYWFWGAAEVVAFGVQSVVSIFSLEVINYIQHYGLLRKELAPGVYEPVGVGHSWNSSYLYSNANWLNLGRHSDHHYLASRGFQLLRHFEGTDAPELPAGFPLMFLVALVPPLWFRIMDPRVESWRRRVTGQTARPDRLPAPSEKPDAEASLASLRRGYEAGLVGVSIKELPKTFEREVLRAQVERFVPALLLLAVVAKLIGDRIWGAPWGLVLVCALCAAMIGVRYLLGRRRSQHALVRSSLSSLSLWDRLWRGGQLDLSRRQDDAICQSPDGDWRSFAVGDEAAVPLGKRSALAQAV